MYCGQKIGKYPHFQCSLAKLLVYIFKCLLCLLFFGGIVSQYRSQRWKMTMFTQYFGQNWSDYGCVLCSQCFSLHFCKVAVQSRSSCCAVRYLSNSQNIIINSRGDLFANMSGWVWENVYKRIKYTSMKSRKIWSYRFKYFIQWNTYNCQMGNKSGNLMLMR